LGQTQTQCQEAAMRMIMDRAIGYATEEQHRSSHIIKSLEAFVRMLAHVPGHKNLMFFSEVLDQTGAFFLNQAASTIDYFVFRYNLNPLLRSRIQEARSTGSRVGMEAAALPKLARVASASDTAVYWVNPEYGKSTGSAGGSDADVGHINGFDYKYYNAPDMTMAMRGVAEDSGGSALSSTDYAKFYNSLAE